MPAARNDAISQPTVVNPPVIVTSVLPEARLGQPYSATVQATDCVTMDETGWRVAGCPHWLHVATTATATVFGIFRGRGFEEAAALIGADYDGFLVHDGWAPYYRFASAFHQSCTQHLITRCRELIHLATRAGAAFPRQVQGLLLQGLALRDRHVAEDVSTHGLAVATGRLEAALDRLLTRNYRLAENQKLANHLIHEFPYLFTYLKCPGVEATNYRGEQAVRPAVVTRKVWGGNRTPTGAHTQELLMSILRTSHQQHQDPVLLLADLLRAPRAYEHDLVPPRAPS
jgi:transposase